MKIDGACHCGNVAFEAEVDPATRPDLSLHGLPDHGGALFRANIQASGETFRLARDSQNFTSRRPKREPARAGVLRGCGTGLYATSPINPTSYVLRVGTIAQRAAFRPAQRISVAALGIALDTTVRRGVGRDGGGGSGRGGPSVVPRSSVHVNRLPGNEPAIVTDQKQTRGGDLVHFPLPSQRNAGSIRRPVAIPFRVSRVTYRYCPGKRH